MPRKQYYVHILASQRNGTAIAREKQIKEWKRSRKVELIEQSNPLWEDLYRQFG